MATQLQIRRGTSAQVAAFTGAEGEIVVNTTNDSVHVNDGSTAGGFELARADLNNVSDTDLNAALTGNTVSALTITTLTLGATAITATGAELNYVDGVTSAIQTQIDAKAPLASPTFTGTVTADALTVDTNTLVVDATNNRVGIGTSTVNRALEIAGNNNGGAKANYIRITDTDTSATANNQQGGIEFFTNDVTAGISASMEVLYAGSGGGGEITFNTNASSSGTLTEALRIDENQNVGIGTSSPTRALSVFGDTAGVISITSNSTDGISSLAFGDTADDNAGRVNYLNASDAMLFYTAATERLRITSAGNVGIGTSSPTGNLEIATSASDTGVDLVLDGNKTSNGGIGSIIFNNNGDSVGMIRSNRASANDAADMLFYTQATGGANTQRMAITKDGNVLVGKTSANFNSSGRGNVEIGGTGSAILALTAGSSSAYIYNSGSELDILAPTGHAMRFFTNGSNERMRIDASGNLNVGFSSFSSMGTTNTGGRLSADGTTNALARGSNGVVLYLYSGSGGAGNITVTGNTASYNETSDQRLKENIVEAPSSSDDIDAIQVRSFDWKADGRHQKYGMIAQELQSVAPEAVSGDADSDEMMGVDYSKLVPMLVKEIQSLRARVAQLEN